MRILLQLGLTFCLISFLSARLISAHIIGGHMSYEIIEYNADSTVVTYGFDFTLYRDALGGGAPFDLQFSFGVYEEDGLGGWEPFHIIDLVGHTPITTITSGTNDCLNDIGEVVIEKASYLFRTELPISDKAYMIAYQRCCRSASVNNLKNPGDTGAAYSITITPDAQRLGNSSPKSTQEPIFFACAGEPFESENTSIDSNGDSLVYKFCAPLVSGGVLDVTSGGTVGCCDCIFPDPYNCHPPFDEVIFADGYSTVMPFGENSSITLDPNTGIISGVADVSGIYAYSICVEEYRNGVFLGRSNREVSSMSMLQPSSNDNIPDETIRLYPNPAHDIVRIESEVEIFSMDLISLQGEFLEKRMPLKENSIDVSALENGIYFLRIQDSSGREHTHKFAKI